MQQGENRNQYCWVLAAVCVPPKTTKSCQLVPVQFQFGQEITVNWLDSEGVVTPFHQ